ncbi:MAG: O-antigen ligase family protein [Oscillatoria sp. PMC 1068.18]|nr:O-antigen ligase family protein [Oscillatoria sp. PMC 1076.18]MEC4989053.1 O-antigen ligase family protein [Oscillatoria sp. PMC 1068.18]
MKTLTTLLYCLSLTIVNPWGLSRGAIWTQPKVLVILVIIGLNLSLVWEKKSTLQLSRHWKILASLWGIFLTITLLFSTLLSPYPPYSFWGQNQMGDGWIYWLIVAVFSLSNILVLKHYPELLRPQIKGLLLGGIIVALSVFPQVIDWRIDYTATMGQLIRDNLLESTIFKNQQPIGLYSHRGHAGFVLAAVSSLLLVVWQWRWLKSSKLIVALSITLLALLFTQNRASLIALLLATIFLLGQKYKRLLIIATLVCLFVVGIATTTRQLEGLPTIKQITSDRIKLWQDSLSGISQRPVFGWGFDGYGSAYAYLRQPEKVERMERVGDFRIEYFTNKGQFRTVALPTAKTHNLILDTLLSVGFIGLSIYATIWFYSLILLSKSSLSRVSILAYTYLIFTLFWFECAQYSHLPWWVLSLWGIKDFELVYRK